VALQLTAKPLLSGRQVGDRDVAGVCDHVGVRDQGVVALNEVGLADLAMLRPVSRAQSLSP